MADDRDPATLTDEELDAILSAEVGNPEPPEAIEPEAEEPEVEEEETPEEVPEVPAEEPEAPAEDPEEEPKPPSRREQLRINQLLDKLKDNPSRPAETPARGIDYSTALDADPEVIKQLELDRQAAVNSAVQENQSQLSTHRWETYLNMDAPEIERKYPQLDKNSPQFNPGISEAISNMYFHASGMKVGKDGTYTVDNPGLRIKDYVESVFELASEIGAQNTQATAKNIASQAAKTGLRPGGGTSKKLNLNKPPEQMTDEELDAVIAQAIPNR